MKFKDALYLTLASIGTGLLLGIFSILKSPFNAIASLIAVVLAIYYFRKNERKGLRIGYVIFSILYYLLFIFMLSVYQFYQLSPASA
ncbi:hypothetical protein ACTHSJ_01585 [Paenibacillus cellulositrophicus]|uniref:Polyferredoxin n=2 Tax=Paenibacillus TaxID=44249 RepID=A0A1R1EUW5_9BACL|nr:MULTISPECIES: hypothetical protein [Paenibacillus]MBB3127475.1 polyferredoxin [Paenibacillus rhizosphaerae]MBJ9988312.1 hypothetical protein [Paenibacillus sp. S28]MCM2999522.1 hypothetical protein [Paenibacillus cellulositrophicus]MEC0176300.1 hypothetical protein [Paenibacillus favisporus]OMF55549.1 hypothetical protein BK138_12840 [Paenibacillus rhizosphaerae]